jgi:hypothetical protein
MNRVLSFLLAWAFLQAETWAIGGGPNTGTTSAALVGTYAGVMVPTNQTNTSASQIPSSASIGLFSIGVPQVGLAQGSAVVFVNGLAFQGSMLGVADPKDQSLQGIVQAQSTAQVTSLVPTIDANGNVIFQQVTSLVFAQGNIDTQIEGAGQVNPTSGSDPSNTRLKGKAQLDLYQSLNADGTPSVTNTVTFKVDGFKQSDTSTVITIALPGTGNNNGTGGTGGTP